jgi:DNA-directed RNA polymerase subunit beta'
MPSSSEKEAILAYRSRVIGLQKRIKVRFEDMSRFPEGTNPMIETSVGRILFNQIVPKEVGFRNEHFDKKKLQLLVREVYRMFGSEKTAQFVDAIKKLGFQWMMNSGISWGMGDLVVPEIKQKLVKEADQQVEDTFGQFQEGLLTEDERYGRTIEIWNGVSTEISKAVATTVKDFSSVYYIVKSGGRGSAAQLMQMAGIKGLVVNPSGATIELPCKSGFKDGLSVLEYFISTHGSRKGMSDTALKTADSGYLTRRLVDVAQDIVINAEDCGTEQYIDITREDSERLNWAFADRIFGRVAGQDVVTADGKVLVAKGEGISGEVAQEIGNSTIEKVSCRSVLRCRLLRGLCAKCYGYDLGFNKMVDLGSAVGIVAAQSIGEPGTQLTMRTFQSGGSASALDITQGLPRVEELLEARSNPKGEAFISEIDGTVSISQGPNRMHLVRVEGVGAEKSTYPIPQNGKVLVPDGSRVEEGTQLIAHGDSQIQTAGHAGFVRVSGNDLFLIKDGDQVKEYEVPSAIGLKVAHGDLVSRGQSLTEGSLSPIKLVELVGPQAAQDYIVQEVINIYASQGQSINEKHIELIVRQMFSKVKIADPGDSQFVPGDVVDKARLRDLNEQLTRQGQKPATFEQLLMGITKISLSTDSWMAAASFQNTTQVLIEAAITGRVDYLKGLKENVIIGKLIPAGTGFRQDVAAELSAPTAVDVTALEMSLAPEPEE